MILQPGSRPVPNCPDYVLVRRLGAGAFGEVWHARGPGGIGVALKFIPVDEKGLDRELRALEATRNIRHPNLVSYFGAWGRDNYLILAMELCDSTLEDRLEEALEQNLPGIPLGELLGYISDAAAGLDALSTNQVQHRDVKPANLLLVNSGVKVSDFGLAKVLERTVASNSGAGTIAYLAPECFRGIITCQSDQYSLAVTYFHLRTGVLPFEGDQAQMMFAHLNSEPDLSRLQIGEQLVVSRALSKDPDKRWPNCKSFVSELMVSYLHCESSVRESITKQPSLIVLTEKENNKGAQTTHQTSENNDGYLYTIFYWLWLFFVVISWNLAFAAVIGIVGALAASNRGSMYDSGKFLCYVIGINIIVYCIFRFVYPMKWKK